MKTYLVTGGAGFIGSAIADRLKAEGHNVYIIDDLSTGKLNNVPQGCEFIQMELGKDNISKIKSVDCDAVFHLAGQSSGEASFLDPDKDFRSHVTSTFQLLQWCRDKGVRRFMYASSMSVYGDPVELPVKETARVNPKSFYGAGKASAENYIRLFDKLGVDSTIMRFFNIYGPGQNLENMRQGMASIYLAYMIKGAPVQVKGSKDRFRDFLYIDDLVDAWMAAYENPKTIGKTYNLCSGKKTTVESLLAGLMQAFAKPGYPVEYLDGTPGDQFGIYGDNALIQHDLKWQPRVSLKEGLTQMVEQVRNAANVS